MTDNSASIEIV